MIIEVKTRRQGWVRAKLLSINKGGTVTILISGNKVNRKIKKIRWGETEKVAKAQGVSHKSKGDARFKTKKRRNKIKRAQGHKASAQTKKQGTTRKRRVVVIAGHKLYFL